METVEVKGKKLSEEKDLKKPVLPGPRRLKPLPPLKVGYSGLYSDRKGRLWEGPGTGYDRLPPPSETETDRLSLEMNGPCQIRQYYIHDIQKMLFSDRFSNNGLGGAKYRSTEVHKDDK